MLVPTGSLPHLERQPPLRPPVNCNHLPPRLLYSPLAVVASITCFVVSGSLDAARTCAAASIVDARLRMPRPARWSWKLQERCSAGELTCRDALSLELPPVSQQQTHRHASGEAPKRGDH